MNKLFEFFIVAAVIPPFLFACSSQRIQWQQFEQSVVNPLLKPDDNINDMVITTGVESAVPLWAFCSSTIENDHLITADCGELSYASLAIGHTFGVMGLIPQSLDWEDLTWQMTLDGHPIDLEAFGTYNFVHPDLAPNPSPVREVFRTIRVWDVVLANPTPGTHTLQGQAQSQDEIYTWVVKFTVITPLHD